MIIPDHALGLPVLRTLSLCTCRRTTPVQRTGALVAQACPSVSAFPETTIGSVCTSSFSRIARRSFTLRPAHSRGHQNRDRYPKASDISSPPCLLRLLPAGAVAGRGLHPLEKRRLVTAHVASGQWNQSPFGTPPPVGALLTYASRPALHPWPAPKSLMRDFDLRQCSSAHGHGRYLDL